MTPWTVILLVEPMFRSCRGPLAASNRGTWVAIFLVVAILVGAAVLVIFLVAAGS